MRKFIGCKFGTKGLGVGMGLRGMSDWAGYEKQMQVLRLTTPTLHPADEDPSAGTPEAEKRLGPLSLRMTAVFVGVRFDRSG